MRKLTALFLVLTLAISLAACAGNSGGASGESAAMVLESGEISGEITVSCYESMMSKAFLEDAAKKFEEKFPGTKVNIETFSKMPEIQSSQEGGQRITIMRQEDDPQAKSDYISKVNTELMSGGGADILAMDILPYHRLAESGRLENLDDFIAADNDFNSEDYRKNILDAARYNDKLFFMPSDYSFSYFAYDSTLINGAELQSADAFTYEQLLSIGAGAFSPDSQSKIIGMSAYSSRGTSLINELIKENYDEFVNAQDKTAHFDDGRFAELLELCRQYEQDGYIMPGVTSGDEPIRRMERNRDERYMFKSKNHSSLLQQFNQNSGRVMSFGGSSAGNEEDDEIAGMPTNENGEVAFSYSQGYSLNANSQNKRTAWEFLKFLLSEEIQTSSSLSPFGLPLNNNARAEKAKLLVSGALFSSRNTRFAGVPAEGQNAGAGREPASSGAESSASEGAAINGGDGEDAPPKQDGAAITRSEGGQAAEGGQPGFFVSEVPENIELDETQQKVWEQYTAQIEKFSDMINFHSVQDSTINDMIAAEIQQFFDGSKSASDVASALQNKVALYLSE